MSKIIEILDSDEDSESNAETSDAATTSANISSKVATPASTTPPPAQTSVLESNTKDTPTKNRNRSRRKSVLQPMRASPDMQFETISLDDDEECSGSRKSKGTLAAEVQPQTTKTNKTVPKILVAKPPTAEELVNATFDRFLNSEKTTTLVRQIAEERARVNFLLSSNNMPEIAFSLNTNPERLRFQLENRIKQREIRNWDASKQMQETKRRRQQLESVAHPST